jgi:hypothetical protein
VLLPTRSLEPQAHGLGALAAALRREVLLAEPKYYQECAWLRRRAQRADLLGALPISDILSPDGMVACSSWAWEEADADFGGGGAAPVWVQGSLAVPLASFAIAHRELGGRGGAWVWLSLHERSAAQLLQALAVAGGGGGAAAGGGGSG